MLVMKCLVIHWLSYARVIVMFLFLINSNHIANVLLIAFMSNVYCAVFVCDGYLVQVGIEFSEV